mmetsp:Transcript_1658/g.2464  ORF Transcript_1658/g.2464 Transcript_1658/m.2464 type:complete len:196 (-) Transcript_1658:13-600(-)
MLAKYPKHKQLLVQKAKERNINLLLMPPGMHRHQMNKTTKYDTKKDTIFWKVEFIFHCIFKGETKGEGDNNHGDETVNDKPHKKIVLTVDRVPELDELSKHLSTIFKRHVSHSAPSETRSALKHFRNAANEIKDNVIMLMKKIPCKSSEPKYSRVDVNRNMCDILKGSSIIEFPTVDVVLEQDLENFPLIIQEIK